jgi:hypothetical protein
MAEVDPLKQEMGTKLRINEGDEGGNPGSLESRIRAAAAALPLLLLGNSRVRPDKVNVQTSNSRKNWEEKKEQDVLEVYKTQENVSKPS